MTARQGARGLARTTTALGLTVAAFAATTAPAAAAPQPMGQCTTSSGAVLAVDFSHWGGPIYRSCGTTPTTGYELLNQGGWRTTGTGHDGPAFICRIGYSGHQGGKQYPTPQQDDCVLTPPASAYWSYWHADPGQNTWTYSQLGAMLYKPRPGSVDLWIFGGTNIEGTQGRPTVTPDQLRAKNTRPTGGGPVPRDTRTAAPLPPGVDTGPAPGNPPPADRATPPPPSPSRSVTASPTPSKIVSPTPTPTPTPSATPSATTGSPAVAAPSPKVVDAAPAADAAHDAGSWVPAVITGALGLLIGAAAVFAAKRRRRTE
ncbi:MULTISPECIES: hypothetical protein [Streptomyces]|uniref:Uncharacterized protein n=3 Tax=Streptomyces TaxID=1883 RepID=B1VXL2_STRGG|nr:hypothetical protein [Streptomyces griseus]BAG18478.1 hypothetical protein SGR_1649 [Streptomyces griseus subsp. griseus NBRC 13350]SED48066.1 hypothetical protein SAMN04490359_0608 [Streptomyces griseus]SQA25748.1 Prenyltrans_2 domain containing protein [Streptomyces griseus]